MAMNRRDFLRTAGLAAGASALLPRVHIRKARGAHGFATHHVVIVGIAGGLRLSESLGMAEGATMPNLFGDIPLVPGFGAGPAGPVRIAPEYPLLRNVVLPPPRTTPLHTEGALVTNLRYAEGAPGHLQGQACLVSGMYNNIENRKDAYAPSATLFEIHRRQSNADATDAWYLSTVGGFYSTLQRSQHPNFGEKYAGAFLAPPGALSPILPLVTSGRRLLKLEPGVQLPVIESSPEEIAAVGRLTSVLDGNAPPYDRSNDPINRATPAENAAIEEHLSTFYADPTYQAYYPDSMGIGLRQDDGGLDPTNDALTVYHAEQILAKFKPSVMAMTLIDIDSCHDDFNAYLTFQTVADALVAHLWDFIQRTPGLAGETTLLVLPEHGRHLFMNGNNTDSFGRSGIDHGQGDDGDRDVWMLALGPDVKQGALIETTGITQPGRTSGRYETIDAIRTVAELLGYGDLMQQSVEEMGGRPGLVVQEMLR